MLSILEKLTNQAEQTSLLGEATALAPPFQIDSGTHTRVVGEFWTAKQRQANSIHEVAYRACFKAQLPNFFISKLTEKGDIVYDPVSGGGTTVMEEDAYGSP